MLLHYFVDHQMVATDLATQNQQWLCAKGSQIVDLRSEMWDLTLRSGESFMKQKITGFEQDDEHHWRAILACGHRQHVRHDPPLTTRAWVLTEAGRTTRIGLELDCKRCDEEE
jgi:uncharacterized protein DUF3565